MGDDPEAAQQERKGWQEEGAGCKVLVEVRRGGQGASRMRKYIRKGDGRALAAQV